MTWFFTGEKMVKLEDYLNDSEMDQEIRQLLTEKRPDFKEYSRILKELLPRKKSIKSAIEEDVTWLYEAISPDHFFVGIQGHSDLDAISAQNILKTTLCELYGGKFRFNYEIVFSNDLEWGYPSLEQAEAHATFLTNFDETPQSRLCIAFLENKLRKNKNFRAYIVDHHINNNPIPIFALLKLEEKYPERFRYVNLGLDIERGMSEPLTIESLSRKGREIECSSEYLFEVCMELMRAKGREIGKRGENIKDPIKAIAHHAMTGMSCDRDRYDAKREKMGEMFPDMFPNEERSQSGKLPVYHQIVAQGNSAMYWRGRIAAERIQDATFRGFIVDDPQYVITGKSAYLLPKPGDDPASTVIYYASQWNKNEYWIRKNLIGVTSNGRWIRGSRSLRQVKIPAVYLVVDGEEQACWGKRVKHLHMMQKFFANCVSYNFKDYDDAVLIGVGGTTKNDILYLSFRKIGDASTSFNLGEIAYKLVQSYWNEGADIDEVTGGGHFDQAGARILLKYIDKGRSLVDQLHERIKKVIY